MPGLKCPASWENRRPQARLKFQHDKHRKIVVQQNACPMQINAGNQASDVWPWLKSSSRARIRKCEHVGSAKLFLAMA